MGQGSQSDATLGGNIKNVIDDFVSGLQPNDVLAGDAPKAIAALQEGRRLAQIGFKSDLRLAAPRTQPTRRPIRGRAAASTTGPACSPKA
jgi:hypothetical protein